MRIGLDIPPGLFSDDTTFAEAGRWSDGSNVRFHRRRAQVIGGWESLMADLLTGVCRAVFGWTDNISTLNIGFGTHSDLQVWIGGGLYTVTPTLAMPSVVLGANPLSVVNTTPTVTVSHVNHGLTTADTVIVSGAVAVGGITPNGTFAVTVVNDDSYTFTFGSNATSTATGGGSAVTIAPQNPFIDGQIDGTGGAGIGTGGYGVGAYSTPSTADYFPRTWALAAWGQNLLANPRGGPIYGWTNDTAQIAAPLANSPRQVTHMLVAPQEFAFALGCNDEVTGEFNPLLIRHSSRRNNTQWNTASNTTARSYRLPGGGRIVAGRVIGNYLLVWTSDALFLGTYIGSLTQVWRFERVGQKCGLIGPNAVVVVGQRAFWCGPDLQFYNYNLGGQPLVVESPIREDFADNMAPSQGDKITASSNSIYNEIRFDYPDSRDGFENSRYIALKVAGEDAGVWHRGIMARTAMIDTGPAEFPIGVTYGGNVYFHERGNTADGQAFSWFIRSADQYLSEEFTLLVRNVYPDIFQQVGPVNLTITSKLEPQDTAPRTFGPYAIAAGNSRTDVRAAGRLFSVEFSGNSVPTAMRLGRCLFEAVKTGRR